MAAPTIDESKPTFGANAVDAAMTQLRSNVTWIIAQLAAQSFIVPGWAATVNGADLSKPDSIELTYGDGRKIKATYTYDGSDNVTGIVVQFDSGSGYETFTNGTATLAYDANDNLTGITWA